MKISTALPFRNPPPETSPNMTQQTLREWLQAAPFSLTMSSGFFGFFAHAGVLSVLEEEGLKPRRCSGSSAGALVTGLWSAGVSATTLRDELLSLERREFWDPRPGLGFLKGRRFLNKLESLLPVGTFETCRVPVAVSVYDVVKNRTVVRATGRLAPALVASCALPGMFHPVWLDGRPYSDGGILDRPGLAGMPSTERVLYHHLASKSPWRKKGSVGLQVPERSDLAALVIDELPRVNPFKLERGRDAFHAAAAAARRAMDLPLSAGEVRLKAA